MVSESVTNSSDLVLLVINRGSVGSFPVWNLGLAISEVLARVLELICQRLLQHLELLHGLRRMSHKTIECLDGSFLNVGETL